MSLQKPMNLSSFHSIFKTLLLTSILCTSALSVGNALEKEQDQWILVDNFEHATKKLSSSWFIKDVQNDTKPFVKSPQIAEIRSTDEGNHYYLKKPAADGIVGNRKALSYIALPEAVAVGDIYTFYTRIKVEAFPNNHSFGLSNMSPQEIDTLSYNAFEPMLRVTDKMESNGDRNSGALGAIASSANGKASYKDIVNPATDKSASPLEPGMWYEVWFLVNNSISQATTGDKQGIEGQGQSYEIYVKGGEFSQQTKVFEGAQFRMKREKALTHFITIANTGPHKSPYGNGGLAYDDIYMIKGIVLSQPQDQN